MNILSLISQCSTKIHKYKRNATVENLLLCRFWISKIGLTKHGLRLPAVDTLKRYSKALEYEYRVKIAALSTLKRYFIISLTLYLEWYCAYSILYSGGPHQLNKGKKNGITHKLKIQIKFRFHH
jgi:hypothetical protein